MHSRGKGNPRVCTGFLLRVRVRVYNILLYTNPYPYGYPCTIYTSSDIVHDKPKNTNSVTLILITPHTMAISKAQKKTIPTKKASATKNSHISQSKKTPKQPESTSRRASVQDSDEDDEPSHVGDVLSSDVDYIMEPIDDGGSPIEVSDGKNDVDYMSKPSYLILKRNLLTARWIERISKDWTAPVYAFFDPIPAVECISGRRRHTFCCNAKTCVQKTREVKRYLDTNDAKSMSNLRKHAKRCWGDEIVAAADQAKNAKEVRATTVSGALDLESITAAFERTGKGKVTYSHRQHTKTEARAEIVRWVAESNRPFSIVSDRGFQNLMKTGRPGMYIPSPSTVSRDVQLVFENARTRIATILQVSLQLLDIYLGITLPAGT